jgi:hypothetical protein
VLEGTGVGPDGHIERFEALPVLNAFLERTINDLQSAGIGVDFAIMPVNEATYGAVPASVRQDYVDYLHGLELRYPAFHVLNPRLPAWPAAYFGDRELHLNTRGSSALTRQYVPCLKAALGDAVEAAPCALGRAPDAN